MLSDNKDIAALQEKLLGALIGIARATEGSEHLISPSSTEVLIDGLLATGNTAADDATLLELLRRAEEEKRKMVPNCFECACPCGRTSDYDFSRLHREPEETRSLKFRLLAGIRDISSRPSLEKDAEDFLYKALIVIGMEDFPVDALRNVLSEMEAL